MPSYLKRVRIRQPQSVVGIDRANAFAKLIRKILYSVPNKILMQTLPTDSNNGAFYGVVGAGKLVSSAGFFNTSSFSAHCDNAGGLTFYGDETGLTGFVFFYFKTGSSSVLLHISGSPNFQNDGHLVLNVDDTLTFTANDNVTITSGVLSEGFHTAVFANHRVVGVQKLWIDDVLIGSAASTTQQGFITSILETKRTSSGTVGVAIAGVAATNALVAEQFAKEFNKNPWQIFKPAPARWSGNSWVSLPTLGRPTSDTSTGQWTPSSGTTLNPMLNEAVASDADFISVAAFSTCELLLAETLYPGSAVQTLSYRASSSAGNGLAVTLKQNGSTIASWRHALTSSVTLYKQILTGPQIALIGSGPLSVTLTATAT